MFGALVVCHAGGISDQILAQAFLTEKNHGPRN